MHICMCGQRLQGVSQHDGSRIALFLCRQSAFLSQLTWSNEFQSDDLHRKLNDKEGILVKFLVIIKPWRLAVGIV